MGGKTGTTTQSVSIPPEVLARYNSVNAQAQATAAQPFQQYSTDPSAFVAQINPQQQAGIGNINQQAMAAQPAYGAAMQGTAQTAMGYSPQAYQQGVAGYMNPFVNQAMGATAAQLQNINAQQQQQLLGNQVSSGAFGGDRAGIAAANLANQQSLAAGQTLGQMASQGYQSAAQNYLAGLGQQGAMYNQLGALGAGAQAAGLQGAQAQIGAGTLQQQTQQAGNTALYNQFLQQQAYPFQVAQFLANIAEGTGALSGSTTTTTQPMPFFSDRRLKENVKRIGETDEGLPIYKFKYKGDPNEQTHIGFMADEVEKVHPEAVGESHGYKTVDYDRAAHAEGGAVQPYHEGLGFMAGGREHHAYGDAVGYGYNPYDPNSLQNLIAQQKGAFADIDKHSVPTARTLTGGFGKHSRVPEGNLPVGSLRTAGSAPSPQQSMMDQGLGAAERAQKLTELFNQGRSGLDWLKSQASPSNPPLQGTPAPNAPMPPTRDDAANARGGSIAYAQGGDIPYEKGETDTLDIPDDEKKYGLLTAASPKGTLSQSGLGLGQAAGLAKTLGTLGADVAGGTATLGALGGDILSILPFLASGGAVDRQHHDGSDGNVVTPPKYDADYWRDYTAKGAQARGLDPTRVMSIFQAESAHNPNAEGDDHSSFGVPQLHYGDVSKQYPKAGLGNDFTKETGIDLRDPEVRKNPDNAKASIDWALDYMKNNGDSRWSTARAMDAQNQAAKADMPDVNATPAAAPGPTQSGPQGAQQGKSNFGYDNLVPFLVGLGTMASSKSPYLGSALLEGLGGGAQAYAALQKQKADIQATEAATKETEFRTTRDAFQQTPWGNIVWYINDQGNIDFKPSSQYDPSKDRLASPPQTGTYEIIRSRLGEPPAAKKGLGAAASTDVVPPSDQTATQPKPVGIEIPSPEPTKPAAFTDYYDQNSSNAAAFEKKSKGSGAMEGGPYAAIPIEQSKAYITSVNNEGNGARNNAQNVHELARTLSDTVNQKGWETPGAGFFPRAQIAGVVNTMLRAFGKDPITDMDSQAQIADKIRVLQGLTRANGAGQESVRALDELANANANPSQNPKAYAQLIGQLMVQTQRSIDQQAHASRWGLETGDSYRMAGQDFERVKPAAEYTREADAIAKTMLANPQLFSRMLSGEIDPKKIDDAFEAQGYHNMSRYFTGGR